MDITAPIRPPEQPRRRRRRGSIMLRFLGFAFAAGMILFVVGSAGAAFVLWSISKDLPDYEVLAKYEPAVMTRIHAGDGSLIAEYARERRIYVPINAIPQQLVNAFLSAEDKNFYQHGGLDIQGILRAAATNIANLQSGRRLVGASTITQQVAKNFLLSSDQTFTRKLKEAILAIRIERAFTKEQILELYLNEIYLGLSSYGVAAAALNYYGESLNELDVAQMAYFAALPKAPNNYQPFSDTKRAIDRRNWVLDQMRDNGYITAKQCEKSKAEPLGVHPRDFGAHVYGAEFFAEEVRRELLDMYGEDKLYAGGLSVRTTLDPTLQGYAHRALVNGLVAYDRRYGWRGPVKHIDPKGDWGETLAKIDIYDDLQPWRLAVVLEASNKSAKIGLRPVRLDSGKLAKERETGTIPYEEVKWAGKYRGKNSNDKPIRRGPSPKSVDALLSPGDVIYVKPRLKDTKKAVPDPETIPGEWSLMQIPKVEGGIVALDPHTGRVLAMSGGFSFDESEYNRATQAHRQPGSSFKPILYSAALDNGYTPSSIINDAPFCLEAAPGRNRWCPKNYGGKFAGPSTLRVGIEHSRNLMTVRLANDIGMPLVAEYARRFGVYENLMPVLSMSLGAGETTLLKLTNAYGMIDNGGRQIKATLIDRIQDRYGRTIWRHDTRDCVECRAKDWHNQPEPDLTDDRKQIVDPHTAYQMTSILEGVVQRGTGVRVKAVGKPVAGKTGTTNDERDAWFVGFVPDLTVGVFVGYDNPRPMGRGETGSHVASPVFTDFLQMALAGKPAVPFRVPPGIKLVRVNHKTGLPDSGAGSILEAFKPGTQPSASYSGAAYSSDEGNQNQTQYSSEEQDQYDDRGGQYTAAPDDRRRRRRERRNDNRGGGGFFGNGGWSGGLY